MERRNRLLIRLTGISSAAIGLSFETPLSSAAEDDEFFYVTTGRLVSADSTAKRV